MIADEIKNSNEKLFDEIRDSHDEPSVNELLELYRNLIHAICPEVDIESTTIDTDVEHDDRGLDFDIL